MWQFSCKFSMHSRVCLYNEENLVAAYSDLFVTYEIRVLSVPDATKCSDRCHHLRSLIAGKYK